MNKSLLNFIEVFNLESSELIIIQTFSSQKCNQFLIRLTYKLIFSPKYFQINLATIKIIAIKFYEKFCNFTAQNGK